MPQENCRVKVRGLATKFTWVESRKQFRAPDRKLYWEVEGNACSYTHQISQLTQPTDTTDPDTPKRPSAHATPL